MLFSRDRSGPGRLYSTHILSMYMLYCIHRARAAAWWSSDDIMMQNSRYFLYCGQRRMCVSLLLICAVELTSSRTTLGHSEHILYCVVGCFEAASNSLMCHCCVKWVAHIDSDARLLYTLMVDDVYNTRLHYLLVFGA